MKIYILSALISIVVARPSNEILAPTAYVLGTPIQSQYHSQDFLGQYAYGYNDGLSAKVESKSLNGITQGGYTYYDANGKLQSVSYIADDQNGFRATGTNFPKVQELEAKLQPLDLPVPVTETSEVSAARAEHLKAIEAAKNRNIQNNEYKQFQKPEEQLFLTLPKPEQNPTEVPKVKENELVAKKEVELKNIDSLNKNQLTLPLLKFESFPHQVVPVLSTYQLKSFAHLSPTTLKAGSPYPYNAAVDYPNYGWSYGYTNLRPVFF